MDKTELIEKVKLANKDFKKRMLSELHDMQYDYDADILYVALGSSTGAFSLPIETPHDEDVHLRVERDSYQIVGLNIMAFREFFLKKNPDAKEAFDPVFSFLGTSDWRFQVQFTSTEFQLFVPAQAPIVKGGVKTYQRGGAKLYH